MVRVNWPGTRESRQPPEPGDAQKSVCLLVITDGHYDRLERLLESTREMLPRWDQQVLIDDGAHRLGYSGAIQEGWRHVETDYVFHLEHDFTFNAPVPLEKMIALLERRPYLAQVALKRQPVMEDERAAGGVVEAKPEYFTECRDELATWTEHRLMFTLNPCVYRASLCQLGWPQGGWPGSETYFTYQLIIDPEVRFAYWGRKFDPPMVQHIDQRPGLLDRVGDLGTHRTGHGY